MASCGKAENPILCARGCGFFGTPSNHNLCSQCYKAFLKEEEEAKNTTILSEKVSSFTIDDSVTTEKVGSTMKIKQRCTICKKKVGLTGFSCKCGGMFCRVHRYPEEHACTFNFKSTGRVTLAKENPLCKADKLAFRI
ncbi:zinc finger A20 and AN1 domain-containing stress-associated protein 6-like [Lycium barbarum]|uniref:zinc finger A20 and AN1 domain-containing stress-associated protein 6-like n=1 Tax=Lycium barbarum TaxID=112863 RepID=UPI00293E322C|nr:zinc finger A20 and AN1 domain-containing stress-associated protein 6-like [Lycium barbarum]